MPIKLKFRFGGFPRNCVSTYFVCPCPLAIISSSWNHFPAVWEPFLQAFPSAGRWLRQLVVMKKSFSPSHELTCVLLSSSVHLLKLYFHPWHWEQHRQCYCLYLCLTTKSSVIRFHWKLQEPTILLKANGICESSSCRLRFMKAPSHKKTKKPKLLKKAKTKIFVLTFVCRYGEESLHKPGPCYEMPSIFLVSSFSKAPAKLTCKIRSLHCRAERLTTLLPFNLTCGESFSLICSKDANWNRPLQAS